MNTQPRHAGRLAAIALLAGLSLTAPLRAEEGYPSIDDAITKKECSACHMAFPAGLLYAGSWTKIMGGLADHFGENASLDEATTKHIADYLVANASESLRWPWEGNGEPPLRITESDWWVDVHDRHVRPAAYADPRIGSKANCVACHREADQGYFED